MLPPTLIPFNSMLCVLLQQPASLQQLASPKFPAATIRVFSKHFTLRTFPAKRGDSTWCCARVIDNSALILFLALRNLRVSWIYVRIHIFSFPHVNEYILKVFLVYVCIHNHIFSYTCVSNHTHGSIHVLFFVCVLIVAASPTNSKTSTPHDSDVDRAKFGESGGGNEGTGGGVSKGRRIQVDLPSLKSKVRVCVGSMFVYIKTYMCSCAVWIHSTCIPYVFFLGIYIHIFTQEFTYWSLYGSYYFSHLPIHEILHTYTHFLHAYTYLSIYIRIYRFWLVASSEVC